MKFEIVQLDKLIIQVVNHVTASENCAVIWMTVLVGSGLLVESTTLGETVSCMITVLCAVPVFHELSTLVYVTI